MPQIRRRALNEGVFRQVNERIEALSIARHREQLEVVCECADLSCSNPLQISLAHYESARKDPCTFIVAPGHNDPEIEIVIADLGDYVLVQKIGRAAEEARVTDLR